MAADNDDRDENSAGSDDEGVVCIGGTRLAYLILVTGESIDFEEHDDYYIVDSDDLRRLESLAFRIAHECRRSDDDLN